MNQATISKPRLSFWQIWNMSFGFLGIQFGFALQNANVSRIFQTLGADVENIALYWLAAPATGLLIQPIIGYMSDRTWNRFGRRRPYFLVGAILAALALILMPNAPRLGASLETVISGFSALYVAIGLLWILDASINISMEPFRALVADMLPSQQRTTGFALQSFFIGTGAVVASALPYVFENWVKLDNKGEIPPTVEWSFYLGAVAFILAVLWTVIKTKEYPPEQFNAFYGEASQQDSEGIKEIFKDLMKMPKTMIQLAFVQFFSWFALFAMWIYTTPVVTAHIYGTTDTASELYNTGANWVGICFAAYNGFAAIMSFLLPVIARRTSRKTVHMISLIAGGLGLASIYIIQNPTLLIVSMLGVGLAWASILSMPYAILAGSLPARKMGTYMGIFNFFIVLPQIVAAGLLGFFIKNLFAGEVSYTMLLGGGSLFLAALLTMIVKDIDDVPAEISETERLTISKDLEIHNRP